MAIFSPMLPVLFLKCPIIHAPILQFNMADRLIELLNMLWHIVCSNRLQKSLWQTSRYLSATGAKAIQTGGSYSE